MNYKSRPLKLPAPPPAPKRRVQEHSTATPSQRYVPRPKKK